MEKTIKTALSATFVALALAACAGNDENNTSKAPTYGVGDQVFINNTNAITGNSYYHGKSATVIRNFPGTVNAYMVDSYIVKVDTDGDGTPDKTIAEAGSNLSITAPAP